MAQVRADVNGAVATRFRGTGTVTAPALEPASVSLFSSRTCGMGELMRSGGISTDGDPSAIAGDWPGAAVG